MFRFDEDERYLLCRVKIIGVGDFGSKLVNYSIANMIFDAGFTVIATKNETLLNSSAPQRIKLSDTTDEDSRKNLSALIEGLNLLFIFTDLTDENISRQIAELSKDILTVAIVPESAPNKEKFQKAVDSLISVEDENIFLMYSAVRCITSLVTEPQMVALDFADVKELLKNSGKSYVAYGKGTGEHSVVDAMKSAINSVKDALSKSKRVLFGIFGYHANLSMIEVHEASNMMQYAAHPDSEIIWSVTDNLIVADDFAEVIIIATNDDEK